MMRLLLIAASWASLACAAPNPVCQVYLKVPGMPPTYECRPTRGLIAMYNFELPQGAEQTFPSEIADISGFGTPLPLTVYNAQLRNLTFLQSLGTDAGFEDHGVIISNPLDNTSPRTGFTAVPTKWYNAVDTEFSVELIVIPASIAASPYQGPQRILVMADGTATCPVPSSNFQFAQVGERLDTRLRTEGAPRQCSFQTTNVFTDTTTPRHIVYTVDVPTGTEKITVNGAEQTVTTPHSNLTVDNWNSGYSMNLGLGPFTGGVPSSGRHWSGTVYFLALYNVTLSLSEIQANYNNQVVMDKDAQGPAQVSDIQCPADVGGFRCGQSLPVEPNATTTNCGGSVPSFVDTAVTMCGPGSTVTRTWKSRCGQTCDQTLTYDLPYSASPSRAPSKQPSTQPTVTPGQPSSAPTTRQPTVAPTGAPSSAPTSAGGTGGTTMSPTTAAPAASNLGPIIGGAVGGVIVVVVVIIAAVFIHRKLQLDGQLKRVQ